MLADLALAFLIYIGYCVAVLPLAILLGRALRVNDHLAERQPWGSE